MFARRSSLCVGVCAIVVALSKPALADSLKLAANSDFTVSAEYVEGGQRGAGDRATYDVKGTVTKDGQPVKNEKLWVYLGSATGQNVEIQTDDQGKFKVRVPFGSGRPTLEKSQVIDCPASLKDGVGLLRFEAPAGALAYFDGSVTSVEYRDDTTTSTNTPEESIIGATVTVTGLSMLGLDADGTANFTDGILRIGNAQGTFLQADYRHVILFADPDTGASTLFGTTANFAFGAGLTSRYITELAGDLIGIPNPIFSLVAAGDLSALTNAFTTSGSVEGVTSSLGGGAATIPEPSSILLVGAGLAARRVARRRRTL